MTREIPLTRGKVALIDDADYERISLMKWSCGTDGYARHGIFRKGVRVNMTMQQVLMGNRRFHRVDHINGDKLDNRRCNLRWATHTENQRNVKHHTDAKSPYKGIFKSPSGRWIGQIWVTNRYLRLGSYDTPEQAALAYNAAALEHFGEFARLNEVPQ